MYRARDPELDRIVAIKIPRASAMMGDQELSRFQREARSVAKLRHASIVTVHEVGQAENMPFLVSDFVEGITLADLLSSRRLGFREGAELLARIAEALDYAHGMGVVHRDVKPSNVMLEKIRGGSTVLSGASTTGLRQAGAHGEDVVPRLMDFGLAKRDAGDTTMTVEGQVLGTPAYMSPEQARGDSHAVTGRSDVYSLGVILYQMLTGELPFRGTARMLLHQVLHEEPRGPRTLNDRIPRDLETICLKCMEKEATRRYDSAAALADDLRRFLDGHPIVARPIGPLERWARWCQRNPRMALLAGTVAALLLLIAAVATGFSIQLARERDAVESAREAESIAKNTAIANEQQAIANAKIAQEQSDLVVESLGSLLTKVQQLLRDVPGARPVREDLAKVALDGLQRVEKSRVSTEGKTDRTTMAGQMVMAELLWETGKRDEAEKYYQQCHDLAERQFKAHPENDKVRSNLAVTLVKLGNLELNVRRNVPDAEANLKRALDLQKPLLIKPTPSDGLSPADVKLRVIDTYSGLATAASRRSDPLAAREFNEASLKLAEELLQADPKSLDYGMLVTAYCRLLGNLRFRLGEAEESRALLERALKVSDANLAANPANLGCKRERMNSASALGDAMLFSGDARAADKLYREALDAAKMLVIIDDTPDARGTLALDYYRLGGAALRLGKREEAEEFFRESFKVREPLAKANPASHAIPFMLVAARCGDHARAARIAEQFRPAAEKSPQTWFQIACCYALCIPAVEHGKDVHAITDADKQLQQTYRDKALEALKRLTAGAYHDVVDLETDPDLDPLRNAPDFKAIVTAVRQKLPLDVK